MIVSLECHIHVDASVIPILDYFLTSLSTVDDSQHPDGSAHYCNLY